MFKILVLLSLFVFSGCGGDVEGKLELVSPPEVEPSTYGANYPDTELFDPQNCNQIDIYCVSNVSDWDAVISLKPNTVVFETGKFDLGFNVIDFPVRLVSSKLWSAELSGDTFFRVESDNVIIEGFRFYSGASPSGGRYSAERYGNFWLEGNNIEILNNYFDSIGINSTVVDGTGIGIHIVNGFDIKIYNNTFIHSHAIAIKTSDSSKRIEVFNNDFLNSLSFGGSGEVFHIGDGYSIRQGMSPTDDRSESSFYRNYISNWSLEKELISIKSDQNSVYQNYIQGAKDGAIVIRMGNDNKVFDNHVNGNVNFPVRISGERNIIKGNYFCGTGVAISFHAEMVYETQLPKLYNSYWAANDNEILDNEFYGYLAHGKIDEGDAADPDYLASLPKGNLLQRNKFFINGDFNFDSFGFRMADNSYIDAKITCNYSGKI
ncbi:hypothetical protein AAEH84_14845 [Shewanella indica]|uniref:hypothetical protein n=1 Tax=Shewanella indica TaxID=768528 RepID=UPI00313E59CF